MQQARQRSIVQMDIFSRLEKRYDEKPLQEYGAQITCEIKDAGNNSGVLIEYYKNSSPEWGERNGTTRRNRTLARNRKGMRKPPRTHTINGNENETWGE